MITSNTISSLDIETNSRNENIFVKYSKYFIQREGERRGLMSRFFVWKTEEKGEHCDYSQG